MLGWPAFHQSNVHSSPLLFDIDKDGVREIALATYNGEVLFFRLLLLADDKYIHTFLFYGFAYDTFLFTGYQAF